VRVLVIGSGGREHALVWKLAQSPHVSALSCAPGNPGIGEERLAASGRPVACFPLAVDNHAALVAFARERSVDLTVVGPDDPLGAGIVDAFRQHGLRIFGPPAKAARLESSKEFARDFMERHGVPTPAGRAFSDPGEARRYAARLGGRCAVKADGLARGKGVVVCHDTEEAERAIEDALVQRAFGEAGARVLIQELVEGREVSLHALFDGSTALWFPPSQDHKRIGEGEVGPMTGGMGCSFPLPFVDRALEERLRVEVVDRTLAGAVRDDLGFRGLLYPGVMLTADGPRAFELNVRFGDPETQVYMPLLETDLLELLDRCVDGRLAGIALTWKPGACVGVALTAPGYPGPMRTGQEVHGLGDVVLPDTKIFHAGTARRGGRIVVAGGRVLTVTAWAATLAQARAKAYAAVAGVDFAGAYFRRDIGSQGLEGAGA
jgi:phosphoribosylamine---glycine ligase